MLLTRCSAKRWVRVASFLCLFLARPATTEQFTRHPTTDSAEAAVHVHATCPARNWIETQVEFIQEPTCAAATRWEEDAAAQAKTAAPTPTPTTTDQPQTTAATATATATESASTTVTVPNVPELDIDSALDNANFLSFEDWKKQNLAKAGQSAENVAGNRRGATAAVKEDRRRPTGISNALESLGDEAEIDIDFRGFGAEPPNAAKNTTLKQKDASQESSGAAGAGGGGGEQGDAATEPVAPGVEWTGISRRHDAGITCKERFNYASFDCASTVLKTNPECQGSSSVLIENKDSYMLNECRAQNKFLILELCDDILVDTVVLANYEFFSSIFRTFRVSVSDRYPAKPDQWKELGVYEARNTREVQAFAVENPLIWARYLKIEFLTHYGNEFYCPLSLVRAHGTTMMEEYKHDGEVGRIEDELAVGSAESGEVPVDQDTSQGSEAVAEEPVVTYEGDQSSVEGICPNNQTVVEEILLTNPVETVDICSVTETPATAVNVGYSTEPVPTVPSGNVTIPSMKNASSVQIAFSETPAQTAIVQNTTEHTTPNVTSSSTKQTDQETPHRNATSEAESKPVTISKEEPTTTPETTRPIATQPPSPNPTTQESFFKSVNKRLQMLESNSTLSLLYIEEQSRILRDAFSKVEKRQLARTSTFLENLNHTVSGELKHFRDQYEEAWKSVASELTHQRIQYYREVYSLSAKLNVVADELVFMKRVSVIQSIMVLICFALVLLSRGPISNYLDLPGVQNMVNRSYSLRRSTSPFLGSRSPSPTSTGPASLYRGGRGHSRNLSEDSQEAPASAYEPQTPTSESPSELEFSEKTGRTSPEAVAGSASRSESSPPVLDRTGGDAEEAEDVRGSRSSQET